MQSSNDDECLPATVDNTKSSADKSQTQSELIRMGNLSDGGVYQLKFILQLSLARKCMEFSMHWNFRQTNDRHCL